MNIFKENQNNNIQNIETHENEEVVEKIEENNNIENESEFSLSLESQKDLARNSIKESKQFSHFFDYGTQTCNIIMKGTEHCTEYSYPHYIEIIDKNSEYYCDQIQFSFNLNFPEVQNPNVRNHLKKESLLLDLSIEELNNMSFFSFSNNEEEEYISEKEIDKQKKINNNKENINNLEQILDNPSKNGFLIVNSYNKKPNNKRFLNISNKVINNLTIQNINEKFQKDKTILQKRINKLIFHIHIEVLKGL